jgi:mono/diheme cytochrome c family protein
MRRRAGAFVVSALLAGLATNCAQKAGGGTDPVVGNVQRGGTLFAKNCSNCHGATGVEGLLGPSLRGESRRKDLDATIVWIHHPQPPMPALYPSPLTAHDVVDIASYVQSL